MKTRPQDDKGRFVSTRCPDPNCDGKYLYMDGLSWECDGTTFDDITGPLRCCENGHWDGESVIG